MSQNIVGGPGPAAGEPWFLKNEEQTDWLARKAENDFEKAAALAQKDKETFDQSGDAKDRFAADRAAADAKEKERDTKLAEEIAEEHQEFAVRLGELQTADSILASDPDLIETDSDKMLPMAGGQDPELEAERTF